MEKEFVTYQQALRLKALGFDEECFGHYQQEWHDDGMTELEPSLQMIVSKQHQHAFQLCTAPTFSQAFRFFREKYNYNHSIVFTKHPFGTDEYQYMILLEDNEYVEIDFKTYEEAESACLDKLIELAEGIES